MQNKKWYKNKNLLIVSGFILIIAAVFTLAFMQKKNGAADTEAGSTAYVLCTLPSGGYYGLIPLPTEGSVSYPIRQILSDGTEAENILHLTPEGFCMESATCANQDCVHQGMVTFENRGDRVLQNCVICLPNGVVAELYTAAEIAEMELPDAELINSGN